MTDEQVLDMPARRFWSMERQITRLCAEADLRQIQVNQATVSDDAMKGVNERLVAELGETCQFQRNAFVKGDPNAKAKFAQAMR